MNKHKGTKMKKKPTFCSTCKNHHPQHDLEYSYLDCMLFFKKRDRDKNDKKTTTITIPS